jgi:hypothetical protein
MKAATAIFLDWSREFGHNRRGGRRQTDRLGWPHFERGEVRVRGCVTTDKEERMRRACRVALTALLLPMALLAAGCSEKSTGPENKPSPKGGKYIWSKQFGDSGEQLGGSVAVDASGNVIITGYFYGTVNFGGGPLTSVGDADVFVAEFGPSGDHLWSKRFGDQDYQEGFAVAVDADGNVFIIGDFTGTVNFGGGPLTSAGAFDIFIAKFSASGAYLWSRSFGDADDDQYGIDVAVDQAGSVIATGYFAGTVDFGGGPLTSTGGSDIYLAKFGSNGEYLWSRRFGDAGDQEGNSVAVDASGNVLLAGGFSGSVDFGGGVLASAGQEDICIAKFTAAGAHLWSKAFGDATSQKATSGAIDVSGNPVITGYFEGTVDFGGGPLTSAGGNDIFLAELNPSGAHLWSKRFGGAGDQNSLSVATDAERNAIITGAFGGTVNFGGGTLTSAGESDIFIAKFDQSGAYAWSKRFGDRFAQTSLWVAADPDGNVVITGAFEGGVNFGGGPFLSAGLLDIFVAKFGP